MSENAFDPDIFMQQTVDGANDTEYPTIPKGEYTGVIDKVDMPRDRKNKDGEPIYPVDITWRLLDPQLEAQMGRTPNVRQSVFLDLTEHNTLDLGRGKNIQLGKLRDALGMNGSGFSLGKLVGAGPAKLSVDLAPDKNGVPRNSVKAVGKSA